MNTPPKAAWLATAGTPLDQILRQMTAVGVDFAEITVGLSTVTLIIRPTTKQKELREVVERHIRGG